MIDEPGGIVFYKDIWVGRDGPQHPERFEGDEVKRYEFIKRQVSKGCKSGGRVLDVGCNIGEVLRLLVMDRIVSSGCCYGLDLDAEYIEEGRKRVMGATFVVGALEYLSDFSLGRFDVIILSEVIEHVIDVSRAFGALVEALLPGGRLVVTTPLKNEWSLRYAEAYPEKHRQCFDVETLAGWFRLYGLRDMEVETFQARADGLSYLMMSGQKGGENA